MDFTDIEDAHVVVLGAAGFLGSHLCARLVGLGARVTAVDNFITGEADNLAGLVGQPGFRLVDYDVTDFLHVPGDVDAVLHFASPASPADYLRWPIQTLKVGSLGTHKALGMARAKDARLLLASTSEVYGDPEISPQPETYWGNVNPVGPRGVYDEAKRFAEAIALAYHRQHDVDVRIARIFNSVLADESILYDDGVELRRESAEVLARRLGGQVDLTGYSVPAFDDTGAMQAAEATAFVGHRTMQRCFEVATRYGRSLRVTGDHSLFVEGPGGEPTPKHVVDLRVGDRVAVAGQIRVPERDRTEVDFLDVWDTALIDPWALHVSAPGLGELPLGAFRDHGLPLPEGESVRVRKSNSRVRLPRSVTITDELLWTLGLYVAEGCWFDSGSKSAFITMSGEEELLERASKVFERELGLHVVRTSGDPGVRAPGLVVHSQLLLLLLEHLGFWREPKRIPGWVLGLPLSRLKWFVDGYREGDGVHSGKKYEKQVRHEFSTTSEDLKNDLVVALGRFGLVPSVGRHETTFKQRTGDRRYPFWRLTVPKVTPWSPLEWDGGVTQTLQARRHGDLVWCPVKHIAEVEPTDLVYDFCVPGHENFLAGTGVLAHNTYGHRMRVDDGRAVPAFFGAALRGEPLPVFGDGTQTRSLCYVDDMIEGLLRLLVADHTGPMNLGNPEEVTVLELAQAVQDAVGNHPGVAFHPAPTDDPRVRCPDTTLAEQVLGWKPQVDLTEGLTRTADWFRTRLDR